ncbi:hypothetical protein AVEN_190087-1 [Araneus ventricosus]|uniref:Uncharacterized protein n=1 Tax=Araneus ventricosus TaxID=182803 RepID=A0A4Y2HPL0_ARAVE|nr:hypothetical protein AVEN_190087-1 [Araneus ventricosus]
MTVMDVLIDQHLFNQKQVPELLSLPFHFFQTYRRQMPVMNDTDHQMFNQKQVPELLSLPYQFFQKHRSHGCPFYLQVTSSLKVLPGSQS